ncbi:MAG: FAD-binding oxidoreductase [Bacteroidetes bacterium]|nr:FAD-binding oxidoreductase [Bacteroidota bacterium]
MSNQKIAIVGAGIFGCSIAIELAKEGHDVTVFEQDQEIMLRATKNNHNRIHYGYHYPRSLETSKQSLDGLISFLAYYGEAVLFGFENYYAIAKDDSLTSAAQFKEFCRESGISYKIAYPDKLLMNPNLISESYLVEEPIYDWNRLQHIIKMKLSKSNIKLKLNTSFLDSSESFDFVINCAYSNINTICEHVGVNKLEFYLQDVIVPILETKLPKTGLTVMDGQFCSIMPKGFEQNRFLLYHAKHSIVEENMSSELKMYSNIEECTDIIIKESSRYFPFLNNVKVVDYYRTTRAIPIVNNDQRLSEIITYVANPNFITIFSGKVSTAVKIAKQVNIGLQTGNFNSKIYV